MDGGGVPLVLVPSAALGPASWLPVARSAHAAGRDCVVPDLTHLTDRPGPYWPRLVDIVAEAIGQLDEPGPIALALHSNAGVFAPVIATGCPRPVAAAVFVDAALPAEAGPTPTAPASLVAHLTALADVRGRLPRWSDWWSADEVAALVPDREARDRVLSEQPRLPLAFYLASVPVPEPWTAVPCAYLRFSDAYLDEADIARGRGWPTEHLRGSHLHQVVDPVTTLDAIVALADSLGQTARRPAPGR